MPLVVEWVDVWDLILSLVLPWQPRIIWGWTVILPMKIAHRLMIRLIISTLIRILASVRVCVKNPKWAIPSVRVLITVGGWELGSIIRRLKIGGI